MSTVKALILNYSHKIMSYFELASQYQNLSNQQRIKFNKF